MSWPTHKTYAVDTTQTRRDITVHMGDHVLHTWFHEVGPPDFDARIPHEHVRECAVPLNTVCEHGVFCTDNLAVAEMVARLCGAEKRERAAVVAYLRRGWDESRRYAADNIERGEHRTQEGP